MVGPEHEPVEFKEDEVRVAPGIEMSFDPQKQVFIMGKGDKSTILSPSDMESPLDLFYKNPDLHTEATEEDFLLINWGGIAVLPNMRRALSELATDPATKERIIQITNKSMAKVFKKIRPDVKLPPVRKSVSPFLFSTSLSPGEGRFFLNTFGNCACLGPFPESYAVDVPSRLLSDESRQLELPAGYSIHNIDFPGQLPSLLAGAGTLAWIAKNGLEG